MAGLTSYLAKRAIDRAILVLTVITIQFLLIRVVPIYYLHIDPTRFLISLEDPPAQREALREQFGLNKPIWEQFVLYVVNLFRLDLGTSFLSHRPVKTELLERLPNTLSLIGGATIIILLAGILVGLFLATRRGKRIDTVSVQLGIMSTVLPAYIFAILFLVLLAWYPRIAWGIKLFPIAGTREPFLPDDILVVIGDYLWHLALPVASLVMSGVGGSIYYYRTLAITELKEDYVLTARAKGLKEQTIMRRHVLKSVSAPVITILGLSIPGLIGGAIITETLFSWYGMGTYIFQGISSNDYPAIQGYLFLIAIITAISLYFVDIVVAYVDPRVRIR